MTYPIKIFVLIDCMGVNCLKSNIANIENINLKLSYYCLLLLLKSPDGSNTGEAPKSKTVYNECLKFDGYRTIRHAMPLENKRVEVYQILRSRVSYNIV